MYIFTFTHPDHPKTRGERPYGSYERRLHNDRGILQRDYLRTKIKTENYSIVNGRESVVHDLLSNIELTNHPLYGVWLTTEDQDLTLMLRLGIEDYMNPKTNFKFRKGYVIKDLDEVINQLKEFYKEYRELCIEKSSYRSDNFACSQMTGVRKSLEYQSTQAKTIEIQDKLKKFLDKLDTSDLDDAIEVNENRIKNVDEKFDAFYAKVEKYLDSFKMNV